MTFLYYKNSVSVVCTAGISISSYIFIWMYPLLLLYLGFFSADMWVIVLIALSVVDTCGSFTCF